MRVLCIDWGTKSLGLALGDTNLKLATPLKPIPNRGKVLERIAELVKEYDVRLVVVGLPLTPSGREGQRASQVRSFVEELSALLPEHVGVELWDERYTTYEAVQLLEGKSRKKVKELKDSVSALIILQEYLDSL
ncbi:Holliday junction resolvase YqgF [Thermocrinis albus DSM 14484]|uniref:Putative pre-16S rRNA nuclease n=1 Tax=Thermocrinis albus (strain DSM 14484 / JCM 11386 / HI 11/12) TaxID=638303 RepID=D3SNP6_THEAH|nr:Holliday junction resolvase RuvX [Thermocrinis albus]ADC88783.1 Holliday junction resolvase YqgF [Thermocrinis albus DSM 14484]